VNLCLSFSLAVLEIRLCRPIDSIEDLRWVFLFFGTREPFGSQGGLYLPPLNAGNGSKTKLDQDGKES
jgi:hypothetical protein